MGVSSKQSVENIRKKLLKNTLLRSELNNPYVEKYIDETIIAIIDEVILILNEHDEEIAQKLNMNHFHSGTS